MVTCIKGGSVPTSTIFLGDEGDEGEGLVLETTTYVLDVGDVDNPTLFSAETWGTTANRPQPVLSGPLGASEQLP